MCDMVCVLCVRVQRVRAAAVQAAVRISDAAVSIRSKAPSASISIDLTLHAATNGHVHTEDALPKPVKARRTSQGSSSSGKAKTSRIVHTEPEYPDMKVLKSAWRPPKPRAAPQNLLKDEATAADGPELALDEQFVAGGLC